jgi:hypothetical protein
MTMGFCRPGTGILNVGCPTVGGRDQLAALNNSDGSSFVAAGWWRWPSPVFHRQALQLVSSRPNQRL